MNGKGQELYRKAKTLIPGGTQLLSKRPEMHLPDLWPSYYSRAKGSKLWDLDGNCFTDMTFSGIGSCILGYADPDVNAAVTAAIENGSMTTLNCPEEIELAELLIELHPWAEKVRYARCGGEAMAIAVRIARAASGRDVVAFCGYHGWHDWYVSANLGEDTALDGHLLSGIEPAGVPRALANTAVPFHYNKIEELEAIVSANARRVGVIVMEPLRGTPPEPGFLERIRAIASDIGAVLVFDEVTSGWRMNSGGIHLTLGVTPDIAVFAKATSNGYPMAAIIGTANVMEAAQKSFISSTYWTERIGPTAALATIRKHRELDVASHLVGVGTRIQKGWQAAADAAGLPITVTGIPPLGHFVFEHEEKEALRTLYTQYMLEKGFLAKNAFYAMLAHTSEDVEGYLAATQEVFGVLAEAVHRGDVRSLLKGPVAHTGFQRLT